MTNAFSVRQSTRHAAVAHSRPSWRMLSVSSWRARAHAGGRAFRAPNVQRRSAPARSRSRRQRGSARSDGRSLLILDGDIRAGVRHVRSRTQLIRAAFAHARIFKSPTPIERALAADAIRGRPNCVPVTPGPQHWTILSRLCTTVAAKVNLVPDAYLAALAIESGSEWITTDRDYARFPGLRWRHPPRP